MNEGEGGDAALAIRIGAGQRKESGNMGSEIIRSGKGHSHREWRKAEERPGQAPTPKEGLDSPGYSLLR